MKKIKLVGTYYEQSHGDALLFDCVKYIYSEIAKKNNIEIDVEFVDILGKTKINYNNSNTQNSLKKIIKKIPVLSKCLKKLKNILFIKKIKKFYSKVFEDADLIVIVGGGLFKYNVRTNFAPIFKLIIEIGQKKNIPVVFNAVGIEGKHNSKDKWYKILQKSINKDTVKLCSTRDRIDVLKEYIYNPKTVCEKVADTGVWTSEALKIKKDENSNIIGLNIITPTRFWDYNKGISEDNLLKFWKDIIQELLRKNYNIKIFTNGMIADYNFAKKVVDYCKLKGDILLQSPRNEIEMVKNISNCKAIIANRLHTCISAYSMDIPVIGIAWNDKLLYWGKEIQNDNRFFDFDNLDVKRIISELEKAINDGYDQQYKEQFKKTIYEFIEKSIYLIKE